MRERLTYSPRQPLPGGRRTAAQKLRRREAARKHRLFIEEMQHRRAVGQAMHEHLRQIVAREEERASVPVEPRLKRSIWSVFGFRN